MTCVFDAEALNSPASVITYYPWQHLPFKAVLETRLSFQKTCQSRLHSLQRLLAVQQFLRCWAPLLIYKFQLVVKHQLNL